MSESLGLTGPDLIADFVTRLPSKPGVYRMFDEAGEVIYVGKAKNLRNRASHYFTKAAAEVGVSRAAVSQTITRLEQQLQTLGDRLQAASQAGDRLAIQTIARDSLRLVMREHEEWRQTVEKREVPLA